MTQRDPDSELVDRARSGDREAFAKLAEQYRGDLESWIRSRLGRHLHAVTEVDDVMQETMVRALESIGTYQWRGKGSFVRWLGGIAENVIRKAAQKMARRGRLHLAAEPIGHGESPTKALRREERFDRLESSLESLPPTYREVIRLARIEGLKHEEIAARMNRSHAAIRQLVIRALRMLRERFGDTESLRLPHRTLGNERTDDVEA